MRKDAAGWTFIVAMLLCGSSHAELGMFSRANCVGFNESVSWDPILTWSMATESSQFNTITGQTRSFSDDQGEPTGRSYAGCQLCGFTGWQVDGTHYANEQERSTQNETLMEFCEGGWVPQTQVHDMVCKYTYATSCNLTEW